MGVIKRGILGGFKGKVANVVGTSWKGLAVMKSLPLSVANPRTVAQVSQRTKFTGVVNLASFLLTKYVKPLNDRFAQGQSGYNLFVSRNIGNIGVNEVLSVDFELAKGKLSKFKGTAELSDSISKVVNLTWDPLDYTTSNLPTDLVYAIAQDTTTGDAAFIGEPAAISTGTLALTSDVEFPENANIRVFVAIRRADGSEVSDTTVMHFTINEP